MPMGIIKLPYELGYCAECIYHDNDKLGSRQCSLRTSTPIRKIKECDNYLNQECAKLLDYIDNYEK